MTIKILNYQQTNFSNQITAIIKNNSEIDHIIEKNVSNIISEVKKGGDQAIIKLCNKFDNTNFKTANDLLVKKTEITQAKNKLDKNIIKALKTAYKRIYQYHQKQLPKDFSYKDEIGNKLGNIWQAIEKIAIYVPGGTASYPSSVLMNAVPAIVAGCKEIIMMTPCVNNQINPTVLAAAEICGIDKIYKIGGAAAIAAAAFGTKNIDKVDKIVGPGNSFVAIAKKQLFGTVGIDMIAGPTDILVIADNNNNPDWVAADLLSQAEHGKDSKAILITDDIDFADLVKDSINKITKNLSRQEIIKESLKKSAIIIVKDLLKDATKISNEIAPEHLEIMVKNPNKILKEIKNAGAIFIGEYSVEAIGDYIAGPSHTLPTNSNAKFASGLSVFDFLKRISIINCSKNGFLNLQNDAALLAKSEGFDAHRLSITIRK